MTSKEHISIYDVQKNMDAFSEFMEKLPEEMVREHYEKLGLTPEKLEESLHYLTEWLSLQQSVPKHCGKKFLENVLLRLDNSLERTKQKLSDYYDITCEFPEVLKPYDPTDGELKQKTGFLYTEYMPKLTAEGYRVGVVRVNPKDIVNFDYIRAVILNAMKTRIYLREMDFDFGNIILVDCSSMHSKQVLSVSPTALKVHAEFIQKTPFKLKAMVVVNANNIIEMTLNTFKLFMSEKLKERIFIYTGGSENFLKHVPLDILPTDYGGPKYSLDEIRDIWHKKLEESRDYFLEEIKFIDERSKNIGKESTFKENDNRLFGAEGSFRKLALD